MTYSEFIINDSALADGLRRTFDLGSSAFPLRRIGTGFKSIVLGSPAGLVFRVARNENAQTGHRRECYVLSKLRSLLLVEVPEVLGYCEESDIFPFGVMMQKKFEGPALGSVLKRSPSVKPIAGLMGELVLAIQTIRQDDLPELPTSSAPLPEETWSYAHSYLKANLSPRDLRKSQNWWEQYCEDWEQGCPVQRFSHGDLWHEHVLFHATDEPRIAGVLDWEYAGFGDPIFDFVPQMRLGREYVTFMLEAYQANGGEFGPGALSRIELYLPYRELGGLCYCLETGDEREAQFCLEKFRAVLSPLE
ncbi:MAG: aminoglycoside phosphotransferase family protein [Gemmatimonadetes bacterium]|nr:aminoglycoside phosphotransferase family protein [Gemmatimonadota bacterium]MYB62498.1 aminoglycoside phosphotransferase family protein [Gemmatimonadota bacterium]